MVVVVTKPALTGNFYTHFCQLTRFSRNYGRLTSRMPSGSSHVCMMPLSLRAKLILDCTVDSRLNILTYCPCFVLFILVSSKLDLFTN